MTMAWIGRAKQTEVKRVRRLSVVAAGLLLGAVAQPARTDAQTPAESDFGETIEVHVVELDVVVSAGGEPVTGLGPADFSVQEDGEPRPVQAVTAIGQSAELPSTTPTPAGVETGQDQAQPQAAGPPARPLYLVHVFEPAGGALHPRLVRATRQVREWIDVHPDPGLLQAVVLLGPEPVLVQPYTSDPAALGRALDEVPGLALGGTLSRRYDAHLLQPATPLVRERGLVDPDLKPTESYTREAEQESEADRLWSGELTPVEQIAERLNLRASLLRQESLIRGLRQIFDALATTPGSKALVYYFAAGGSLSKGRLDDEQLLVQGKMTDMWSEISELAATTGFRVYGSDILGLGGLRGGAASNDATALPPLSLHFRTQEVAAMMATRTGGRSWSLNEQREILARAVADHRSTYRLAVSVPHGHDAREHRWKVEVARPGVEVRYPRSWVDASPRELLLAQLRTPSTLPKQGGALPLRLRVDGSEPRDDGLSVSLEAGVLARAVGLVPRPEGVREGSLEVYVATYSPVGRPLSLDVRPETFRLSGEGALAADQAFAVHRTVELPAAGGTVAVGFYDAVDGGTALRAVRVVPPPAVARN